MIIINSDHLSHIVWLVQQRVLCGIISGVLSSSPTERGLHGSGTLLELYQCLANGNVNYNRPQIIAGHLGGEAERDDIITH